MREYSLRAFGIRRGAAVILATVLTLVWATAAHAQSADVQYKQLAAPSGPAAGAKCSEIQSADGLLNAGDFVVFPGGFAVAPGASIVLEDSDGTQGTLIDGENAEITDRGGDIQITLTGNPANVAGADGVLSDDVCDSIVTTTGVSAGQTDSASGPLLGVLPDTGGTQSILLLGALALMGTGFAIFRRRAGRQR